MHVTDQQFLSAILTIFAFILTSAIAPYLRAHTTTIQRGHAMSVAHAAVTAIEMLYPATDGYMKQYHAITRAEELGKRFGLKLTDNEWETLIEQAVHELKQYGGEVYKEQPDGDTNDPAHPAGAEQLPA